MALTCDEISSATAPDRAGKLTAELGYLKAVHKHFVDYLAGQYRNGMAVEIAGLCDETLDRSGRLLGEVRESARSLPRI